MCDTNKSLHGCTFSSIQDQLSNVEMKKTYVLNPLAKEFIPRALRNQMLGAPIIGVSPHVGVAAINQNLHPTVISPSHTPTPPIPGGAPVPMLGGFRAIPGALPGGGYMRPASPVPSIDPYTGQRILIVPMNLMHMPMPVRMVPPNAFIHPFHPYPYMEPSVPYPYMHQGSFMVPPGVKQPLGPQGSPVHQPSQDKSQGAAAKDTPMSPPTMPHPGTTQRIPPGSPARDPRAGNPAVMQQQHGGRGGSNHERQEVVAKIEEMQINEEYQYLLRTRGQHYADNFLANHKAAQSPKVDPGRRRPEAVPQSKMPTQQPEQERNTMYMDRMGHGAAAGSQQPPFSKSTNHWNTRESNQPDRDPWPVRSRLQNPRDNLNLPVNQPRIPDPAIIDQGPAFNRNNHQGRRLPYSPLEPPPNVFVDSSHMPPYRDHESQHQKEFSVQATDLSPRTPANFLDRSPGISPLELALKFGESKAGFLDKSQSNTFSFNGASPLTSPRDDPNHLAPPSTSNYGRPAMASQEHTFRPVIKEEHSSNPHSLQMPPAQHRWPTGMTNNYSSPLSPQHEYNKQPPSMQNYSPTTPSLSSQESLPSPSSPYGQGSASSLGLPSTSPTNIKEDGKPLMSYASALRAPPKSKVHPKDDRIKTASPDPLSLIKDLGNRQTKDGFYSIF